MAHPNASPGAAASATANEAPDHSGPASASLNSSSSSSSASAGSAASDAVSDGSEVPERVLLDDRAIRRALMRIAHEIEESTDEPERLFLVAIPNGGVPLGRLLVENLKSLTDHVVPMGIMDTTLYRDDLSTRSARPRLRQTEMPSSVDDRIVVLVEDVVNTGRTIRAAMDALMDFGRPSQVRVVALVDRGHRELPIKIDYVGKNIPTQPGDKVVFSQAGAESQPGGGTKPEVGILQLVVRGREPS